MKLQKKKYRAYDVETTGLSPYAGAEIFAYCIADTEGEVGVYRVDGAKRKENIQRLQDFFDDTSIVKIAHNAKFELKLTRHFGIHIPEETEWHDTMLMSQLLRNRAPSHALDYLCWELCGYPRDWDVEVRKRAKVVGGYQNIPESLMTEYQKADGERTMLLFQAWFHDHIVTNSNIYQDYLNEIALIKTLDRMEDYGIDLCRMEAEKLVKWLVNELESVRDRVYQVHGEYINLNSEDQVIQLLYKKLELPILEYTDKGKPATGKEVLLKLKEICPREEYDWIFKQRSYTKGVSIIRGYIELADKRDQLHANIKGNHAVTGRLASENPNLMNVSKEGVLKNPFAVPARRCFKVRKGHILLFVDYAGIELRLGIEVAKSVAMMEVMRAGKHPHIIAAHLFYSQANADKYDLKGKVFHSKAENKDLYGAAKNAHFALMYGAGLAQIADTLTIPIQAAKMAVKNYENQFPEIANLSTNIARQVAKNGYVLTPFGRKLGVSVTKAYSGLNYLIQGTAAGILKRALVRVDNLLKNEYNDEIRLVLPIHDEIVISYPRARLSELPGVLPAIRKVMIDMDEINVPLEVEWKMTTSTWDRAKEISC